MMRWLWTLVAITACSAGGSGGVDPADDRFDDPGVPVIDVALGESLTGVPVETGSLVVFRLELTAGDSFAAVMRAESDGLDSYLLLKGPDKSTLRIRDDQAATPMARKTDSVLSWTVRETGTHVLFAAGGADLETAGTFRIDLIELSAAPDAEIDGTGPGQSAVNNRLSELEPDVAHFVASGAVFEGSEGLLESDIEGVKQLPLAERAKLNGVLASVNDARATLFELVPAPRSFAELWIALRR